jgi:hypothetical protein
LQPVKSNNSSNKKPVRKSARMAKSLLLFKAVLSALEESSNSSIFGLYNFYRMDRIAFRQQSIAFSKSKTVKPQPRAPTDVFSE